MRNLIRLTRLIILFGFSSFATCIEAKSDDSVDKILSALPFGFIPILPPVTQENGFYHTILLKNAADRIRATLEGDWQSQTNGDACTNMSFSDHLASAPTNSSSMTFVALCTILGTPRDFGKIRVPIYIFPRGALNFNFPSRPQNSSQIAIPSRNYDDLTDSIISLGNFHASTANEMGGECQELYFDSPGFYYAPFCQVYRLKMNWGYQSVKLPVLYDVTYNK